MIGPMIENGTRRIAANSGTQVSTTIRPTMLPRYIDAMSPQTKSFCSVNSSGPGWNAQSQHRQQRAGARGVRGSLGRGHAFDLPGAELVAILREFLGQPVAHER